MPNKKKKVIRKKKTNDSSSPYLKIKEKCVHSEEILRMSDEHIPKIPSFFKKKSCSKRHNKKTVKRILCPFNRFANNRTQNSTQYSKSPMAPYSSYSPTGLSSKEKSYVICSCQSKSARYTKLKNLAADAIRKNKIFSIYGNCNAVRKALLERGWVEKILPNHMNLTKIRNGAFTSKNEIHNELERLLLSNLVEKYSPNFIWRTKDEQRDTTIDMTKECHTVVNKLKIDAMWTTKQGLCSSIKRNCWFYIDNVAEVNGPRTYSSYDEGEIEEFVRDFKITACTSLLKWILSMVANDRPIFIELGSISMNVVVFALNRCKEYLFRKQNKDIDRSLNSVSYGQWNSFLKKYYRIIAKDDVFQADKSTKLPLYLGYAKFLLKEMHKYRPQLSCEGCHNIWIIKPNHCSRGRGIRMASKLGVMTTLLAKANSKYVIQKYIEEPLLIHETKFDIRQYYLVTSTYPMVIWMYTDCYLKFSSQKYSLKNYHESIHLTNNAVQRKYKNCARRHPELPNNNMWDLDKYKDYLNRIGKEKVWNNIIYPGMRKSIIGIMLSCQDNLSVCKNRFELYGCDFILDKEFKPWLIEINSCPDLNHTTQVTAKICPAVISDIIKVVIDRAHNSGASTGKFECIFRQSITIPRYGAASELYVRGYALPMEYFYKGNIEIQESYDDPDIVKEKDIKAVLNKLKEIYETDVMIEPEDDLESNKKVEKETFTHHTASEFDLKVAATVITEQVDELLDRITSKNTFSTKSYPKSESLSSLSRKSSSIVQNVKSLTDIKTLLKKSISQFASVETVNIKQSFNFSKLDDGPLGKSSWIELGIITNALNQLSTKLHTERQSFNTVKLTTRNSKSQEVFQATSKLLRFMLEKEKEYFSEYGFNTS